MDRRPDGIVVRGAKIHTSVSTNTDEVIVLPTRAMKAGDEDYSVAFALPIATKGPQAHRQFLRRIQKIPSNILLARSTR